MSNFCALEISGRGSATISSWREYKLHLDEDVDLDADGYYVITKSCM